MQFIVDESLALAKGNGICIPLSEYQDLKKLETDFTEMVDTETRFYKDTIELLKKENSTLKAEFYSLADKITALENTKDNLLEEIQQNQKLILKSLQGIENNIGAGSSG